jgi:hypothetical protein
MYSYDRRAARPIPVDKAQARKLAKRIVKDLPGELRFRPDDMQGRIDFARGYRPGWVLPAGTYLTQTVQGDQVEVPVRVKYKALEEWGVRRWVSGGGIEVRYHGRRGYGSKMAMNLFINSGARVQDLLDHLGEVEDELYSVIIHEATHLMDLLKLEYAADDVGEEAYHNAPSELRAFMQQIADELITEAQRLGQTVGAWGLGPSPSGDMVDTLLSRSTTWERIRKSLKPASTKLILRGVTRALQDAWPELLEKYKDE